MIWALLALLGVPVWLVVGMLVGALWSRRSFRQRDGVFKIAMRPADVTKWKRSSTGFARSFSNVLVINTGLALVRTRIHVVQRIGPVSSGDGSPRGFENPEGRLLVLADGRTYEVAAEAEDLAHIDSTAAPAASAAT